MHTRNGPWRHGGGRATPHRWRTVVAAPLLPAERRQHTARKSQAARSGCLSRERGGQGPAAGAAGPGLTDVSLVGAASAAAGGLLLAATGLPPSLRQRAKGSGRERREIGAEGGAWGGCSPPGPPRRRMTQPPLPAPHHPTTALQPPAWLLQHAPPNRQ